MYVVLDKEISGIGSRLQLGGGQTYYLSAE
jgi:hypothetical protein